MKPHLLFFISALLHLNATAAGSPVVTEVNGSEYEGYYTANERSWSRFMEFLADTLPLEMQ